MPVKRHSAEQIVRKLREAEVELARGATVKDACRKLAITEHTYYRWRREYGGLKLNQARKLKQLEKDNSRLKKLVADRELDLRSSRRSRRETSEPSTSARGGSSRTTAAGRNRKTILPGAQAAQDDTAIRAEAGGRRATGEGQDRGVGSGVWTLWVPEGDGVATHAGLICEPQTSAAYLAARRAEGTEQTIPAMAQRWLVHPAASTAPRSHLGV